MKEREQAVVNQLVSLRIPTSGKKKKKGWHAHHSCRNHEAYHSKDDYRDELT